MRRVLVLVVVLAALLSGRAEAQSCDGCGIGYHAPGGPSGLSSSGTAITSTVPILLPDGSAAAPSLAFANDTDTGFLSSVSNYVSLISGGSIKFLMGGGGFKIYGVDIQTCNSAGINCTYIANDAANTLALRNSTNAQTFNIYNTYTDGSNNEPGKIYWTGNIFTIQTLKAGTGTVRGIAIRSDAGSVVVGSTTSDYGVFNGFGIIPGDDDTRDLGIPNKFWRNVYTSRSTQGAKTKALTESSATTVATVAVPQTAGANFAAGEVRYTVYASDGTDSQALNGSAFFSAVNKAGTETCTITDDQIASEAASTGTLTCTLACAVGLTDVVGITFDCASSLTQSTLNALVRFDMQQVNTLAFP